MISKDFHASRRALYASVLKDDSVGFVFAGRGKGNGKGMKCIRLSHMPIFII